MSAIEVFTTEHVARLTGLSERQIDYWDRSGVFSPSLSRTSSKRPDGRIYSFRDVVILRSLALVSDVSPSQDMADISRWLRRHTTTATDGDADWDGLQLLRDGDTFRGDIAASGSENAAHGERIELKDIAYEMRTRATVLGPRLATDIGRVQQHPDVVHNAPVLAGTRIPTRAVWDFHVAGYSTRDILREYPTLTDEDVAVAIEFERSQQHAVS